MLCQSKNDKEEVVVVVEKREKKEKCLVCPRNMLWKTIDDRELSRRPVTLYLVQKQEKERRIKIPISPFFSLFLASPNV